MTGIFISYRRIDSRVYSGRLFDRLSRHFGRDSVFMDVEGGISKGEDFADTIERVVNSVDAMVVVIGRQWSTCTDVRGGRRLDNTDDWVRKEIAVALDRDILLLPVLVDGASMPSAEEMPENIRQFARKQAAEISDSRWDYDVGEIIEALERIVMPSRLGRPRERPPLWDSRWFRRTLRWVGWGFAALAGLLITLLIATLAWDYAFVPDPGDFDFTVDPPQIRIHRETPSAEVQVINLRLTNTGKRPALFQMEANFYAGQPSPGVLVIDEHTCKEPLAVGATCTARIVFDPKWMDRDEQRRDFYGELSILARGNGRTIPLQIEH